MSLPSVAGLAPVISRYASQHTYLSSNTIASANVMGFPVEAQIGPNCPVAVESSAGFGMYIPRYTHYLFLLMTSLNK